MFIILFFPDKEKYISSNDLGEGPPLPPLRTPMIIDARSVTRLVNQVGNNIQNYGTLTSGLSVSKTLNCQHFFFNLVL